MKRANDESIDSPFMPHGHPKNPRNTRILKQKLCGGISAESPTYFQLKYSDILDPKSRTSELFKGHKHIEKSDALLVHHPELVPQERKCFVYEDFKSNGGKKIFDYSSLKPSDLIDVLADKRPEFKKSSNFYKKYAERLNNNGFGLTRGIFTVESNQRYKFGMTHGSHFINTDRSEKEFYYKNGSIGSEKHLQKQIISEQAHNSLPVQFRTGKNNMQRYLSDKEIRIQNNIRNKKQLSLLTSTRTFF